MIRLLIAACLITVTTACLAEEPMAELPTPHYEPHAQDPDWLAYAAQFHGHLGPWAAAGLRCGMAGRRAVDAQGYFDLTVTVYGPLVKPPKSCLLDGVQVATGATWGKRNIKWVEADRLVVRVENTRSGKAVEVRPTPKLMKLLTSFKPSPEPGRRDDRALEAIARKIATLPEAEILQATEVGEAAGE